MVNLPNPGQASWDVPLNTALATVAHGVFNPDDLGFLTWNYDPVQMSSMEAASATSGSVRMHRMPRITQNATITNIHLIIGSVSVTPVSGQNQVGLYDSTGTLLGSSMDATSYFGSEGLTTIPLAVPVNVSPGVYYAAVLQNAGTPSSLGCCAATEVGAANGLATNATARFSNGPTGQTNLPASVVMSSRSRSLQATWAGLS